MSDKETLPVEGPQVAKSLLHSFRCPVCLEYMEPPITICSSGHSVCQACKPNLCRCPTCRQPLAVIRNVALKSLTRKLQVRLACSSEQEYGCPLQCPWRGRRSKVRNHVSQTHCYKILKGTGENSFRWNLPLVVRDTRVIFAFGEVFLYRQRLHRIKKMICIVVQYLIPAEDVSRYKYEVEFCSSSGDQKVALMGNIIPGTHQDIDAMFEAGNCVALDYDVVKRMAKGNQRVYSLRVFKSGSTLV